MILSFFAFLLISFSIVFGLASFATGLHNEMPEQIFQRQKYETGFRINSTFWDQPGNDGEENQFSMPVNTYNDFAHEKFIETFNELVGADKNETKFDSLVRFILDYPEPGNLTDILKDPNHRGKGHILHDSNNLTALEKADSYLLSHWNNTNFASYALIKNVFPYTFKGMEIWNWNRCYSQSIGANETLSYYLLDKNNPAQKVLIDTGTFVKPEYKDVTNVVFTSSNSAKKYNYKVGQKIEITFGDQGTQAFTYGGQAAFAPSAATSLYHNQYMYYIMNYQPTAKGSKNGLNFKKLKSNNYTSFEIRDLQGPNNRQRQFDAITSKAYDPNSETSFLNKMDENEPAPMDSWAKDDMTFNAYIVYIGMTMFSLIVGIIMIVLDIIVAWFLIKEIIRSLSTQLLFLKTLGMTNQEAALIPSATLSIFLILSLGLGLVGMLGIQALFISITSKFLIEFNVWSQIKPFSLVIIFGIAIFLSVIYLISTFMLLKKIDLTSNSVFAKSGSAFGKFRGFLFSRNVNSGLTFAFTMKNIKKVIAAFCITILVTALSYIALGFKTAINRGIGQQRNFVFKQETSSYYNSEGYINYSPSALNGGIEKMINYLPGSLPVKENIGMDDLINNAGTNFDSVRGKYITRDQISKFISNLSESDDQEKLSKEWNAICKQYDMNVNGQWKGQDTNFSINFGTAYYSNYIKETVFRLNDSLLRGDYQTNKLFILDDSDPRIKELFNSNETFDPNNGDPVLPVVVGATYLRNNHINKGDKTLNSYIDYHAQDDQGNWLFMKHKDNFKIQYNSSTRIVDSNEVYVKKSEFLKLLTYQQRTTESKYQNFYNYLITDFKDNQQYNTFMNNGVPLALRQFVLPATAGPGGNSRLAYLHSLFANIEDNLLGEPNIGLYKFWENQTTKMLTPIMNAMIVLLILIICLAVAFIIFMVMSIMNENDDIIFILKALGYSRSEILWRMTAGYIIAIWLSVIIGTIIGGVILTIMNGTFVQILGLPIGLKISGAVAGLFIALFFGLPLCIITISDDRIKARNLTTIDNG